jgi:hypothetical protein
MGPGNHEPQAAASRKGSASFLKKKKQKTFFKLGLGRLGATGPEAQKRFF